MERSFSGNLSVLLPRVIYCDYCLGFVATSLAILPDKLSGAYGYGRGH